MEEIVTLQDTWTCNFFVWGNVRTHSCHLAGEKQPKYGVKAAGSLRAWRLGGIYGLALTNAALQMKING